MGITTRGPMGVKRGAGNSRSIRSLHTAFAHGVTPLDKHEWRAYPRRTRNTAVAHNAMPNHMLGVMVSANPIHAITAVHGGTR
jgi:hypothetical protein